jgi:large subunit ribosomal protein L4
MELIIHKVDGTPSGEIITLRDEIFTVNDKNHLIYQAVLAYLANQRQGTHQSKTRAMVSGGGRKPWRQKGTGRARAGSIRSIIWRGGGKAFGPHPHRYTMGINQKEKRLARRAALSDKARNNAITLVEDFTINEPKAQFIADILKALNINTDDRTILVLKEHSPMLWQSCRNIKNLSVRPAYQLCTYDIVRQERIIVQKSAMEHINEVF